MADKIGVFSALAIKLIGLYRRHISRHVGIECLFIPTCSEYAELAIKKYGFIRGISKSITRIKRCVPGNGGEDYP